MVENPQKAAFLQNANNWEIIEGIRAAGSRGVTTGKLAKDLDINPKIVADSVKQLAQMEWIESETSLRRKRGRPKEDEKRIFAKPAKLHVWSQFALFDPIVDQSLEEYCKEKFDKHAEALSRVAEIMDRILKEMRSSANFFPIEPIHEQCGWSHEGHELARAFLITFAHWLMDNERFGKSLKELEIANDDAFAAEEKPLKDEKNTKLTK
jgi:Mn-dependent DtxR family transcriptional regulator